MTTVDFKNRILGNFAFPATSDQHHSLDVFASFLACRGGDGRLLQPVMILRGSAGTGKTSIVAAMIKTLVELGQKVVLLAPTGRAAKVLSNNSRMPASTIHRKIYRQKKLGDDFNLDVNLHTHTLFVIDEASMISTRPQMQAEGMPVFGSEGGSVIDDLVTYVYSGRDCRMMLVGDTAQLPPVGEEEAPALQRAVMECYGLRVFECDLSEVVRQEEESGILWNATMIRQLITHDEATALPRIMIKGFADVRVVQGADLIEALEESYSRVGEEETIVITRSNKRANIYNNGIRMRVVDHEGDLCSGDRIMVVKNHYFEDEASAAPDEDSEEEKRPFNFIANGDMAVVRRVRNVRGMYGFRFADLTLRFTDYDDYEMQLTAVLDVLQSDAPAMTAEQRERLFNSVLEDYSFITRKNERLKAVMTDQYYNALQIKFAYAVTCHKAQGGQWRHVYVDQGYMTDDMLTPDYIHWLYTAFTRATDMLSLVNWPENQLNS